LRYNEATTEYVGPNPLTPVKGMVKKSIKHRKPVMGLLDRRMGKPVRAGSPSTRGGFSVYAENLAGIIRTSRSSKIMIIIILVVAIFFGLLLSGLLAPIFIVANKKKLKEMDKKIEEFESRHFSSTEEREKAKQLLKKELVKLKSKITADKKSTEEASDKISIL
jgi:hypothetical protein